MISLTFLTFLTCNTSGLVPFLPCWGMASAVFTDYYTRCFSRIDRYLHKYRKHPDPVYLVKVRTSIKKIRACLLCIEYYRGSKLKDIRHHLKKHFDEVGKVRDVDMHKTWLEENGFPELAELIRLEPGLDKKTIAFSKLAGRTKKDLDRIRGKMDHYARHIGQEKVGWFFIELIRTNLHLPFGHPPRRSWHAKRKNLKRIVYARNWQEGSRLRLVSKIQSDWMRKMQAAFGAWHDNEEMVVWMKEQAQLERSKGNGHEFGKAIRKMKEVSAGWAKKIGAGMKQGERILKPLQNRMERL